MLKNIMLHHHKNGFTLIEVLVALAIIGIALAAIIKSTSQNLKETQYLQQKILASFIAERILNEARVGLIKLSNDSEVTEDIKILGEDWQWSATLTPSPNARIKEIKVSVRRKDAENSLLEWTTFIYAQT